MLVATKLAWQADELRPRITRREQIKRTPFRPYMRETSHRPQSEAQRTSPTRGKRGEMETCGELSAFGMGGWGLGCRVRTASLVPAWCMLLIQK